MSDNRTADFQKEQFETQQSVHYWAGRLIGHDQAYDIAGEIVEAIAYASQQTASLREENDKMGDLLTESQEETDFWKNSFKERTDDWKKSVDENTKLQEEVERLRGRQKEFGRWLMNIGISGRTFEQLWSEFEALSSKESKPS